MEKVAPWRSGLHEPTGTTNLYGTKKVKTTGYRTTEDNEYSNQQATTAKKKKADTTAAAFYNG